MIVFEDINDFKFFLDKLKDKTIPIFISKKEEIDANEVLKGSIEIYIYLGGTDVYAYRLTEGIRTVQLIRDLEIMKLKANGINTDEIERKIKENINEFYKELDIKYNNILEMLKEKNFINIFHGGII